ncbi:unnamed protein product, partial [Rotaria sp. Silwood2]
FTDDTSMALCLAISLIACQDFNPYDQLVRYKWWYRRGYMSSTGHCFDIGAATKKSLQEFEKRQTKYAQDHGIAEHQIDFLPNPNLPAFDVRCSKEGVAGNAPLMRIAPVPTFFFHDPVKAIEYSGMSGEITHGDVKAYDACCYYGALIVAALNGEDKDELTSKTFYDKHLAWFGGRKLDPEVMEIARGSYQRKGGYEDGIRGKGYIINAMEAALWAFWSEDSFEKGILNAVNLGDDTDTTAAIYGQLAGAHYGYKKIPGKWLKSIYAKDFIRCISSWITYEGEKWFRKQSNLGSGETINSVNNKPSNAEPNVFKASMKSLIVKTESSSIGTITSSTVQRKGINPVGHIGCLYDGWRDHLIESSNINLNIKESSSYPWGKCMIKIGDKLENRNILQLIDFPTDLRLSVLSDLVIPEGIAAVINYPYEIDEYTRIFYYTYLLHMSSPQ